MPAPNRTELRTFIVERFNRNELGILCSDYFPDFYRDYEGVDTPLTKLAEALVAHCDRRDQLERLRSAVHAARTKPYEASFGAFIPAEVLSKPRNPKQAFLSYAHKDETLARDLATELRAAGLMVWIAADGIQPGEKWAEAIDRGLAESSIFIVLLTPNSATSKWVKHEIYLAIQAHFRDEMQILPLKMAACDDRAFPTSLSAFQFVLFESDYAQGRRALFKQLGVRRVVPLHNDLQHAIASSLTAVRKGAVEELAALLNHPDIDLADTACQALERLCDDDSRVVSNAALAALKPVTSVPLISISVATPPSQKVKDRHTLTLAAGVTLDLVRVPAGEFLYGDKKEKCTLPEYWIGKTPVTVSQFQAFLNTKPNFTPDSYWKSNVKVQQTEHPAKCVSWEEAKLFCEWVSKVCRVVVTLPTEIQWEKAARGTDGRDYPWGNTKPDDTLCNFNKHDAYMKASGDDNYKFTTVVGSYSPKGDSPYACVDMAGNVWEWCEDVYEGQNARVLRGGSFVSFDSNVRCAFRYYDDFTYHRDNIGFRVCVPHLSNL